MSGKATAMKSLKEKWLSRVQSVREKGEKGIGGSSTVTSQGRTIVSSCGLAERDEIDIQLSFDHYHMPPLHYWVSWVRMSENG